MRAAFKKLKTDFSFLRVLAGGVFGSLLMGVASCQTQVSSLKSFCYLDFNEKMCWTSRAKTEGFPFSQMQAQQDQCAMGNTNVPCWLGIDTADVKRIADKLNRCENENYHNGGKRAESKYPSRGIDP